MSRILVPVLLGALLASAAARADAPGGVPGPEPRARPSLDRHHAAVRRPASRRIRHAVHFARACVTPDAWSGTPALAWGWPRPQDSRIPLYNRPFDAPCYE